MAELQDHYAQLQASLSKARPTMESINALRADTISREEEAANARFRRKLDREREQRLKRGVKAERTRKQKKKSAKAGKGKDKVERLSQYLHDTPEEKRRVLDELARFSPLDERRRQRAANERAEQDILLARQTLFGDMHG